VTPKYSFKPAYEAGVTHHLVTNAAFAGKYFSFLAEELFSSPQGKLAYKLLKGEVKANGAGFASYTVFEQRLHREHVEGRLTPDDHDALLEYVIMGGWTSPDPAHLEPELIATLEAYIKGTGVNDLMMTYAKKGDIAPALSRLLKLGSIGKTEAPPKSFDLDSNFFSWLKTQAALDYIPSGADAVDAITKGGLPRRCAGLIIGGTGGGKSMFASQVTATSLVCGLSTAYISLEIGEDMVGRRLAAALSGIPLDLVAVDPMWAQAVIEARNNKRGLFRFTKLPGLGTTIMDIRNQLRTWCQELGIPGFDVIVVDYVDRIAGITHIPKETNGYALGGQAMQALHDIAEEHNGVLWTPSQATRQKNAVKQDLGVDDAADSMHKPRIADTVLSINLNKAQINLPNSNNMEVQGKIVKDRNSKGHLKTPPQRPMFAYGYTFPSSYLPLYNKAHDPVIGDDFQNALMMWKLGNV